MGSKEGNYIERYWRDATPEDAIREPPMVARFLSGKSEWFIGKLCGCWRDLHGDNPKWGDGSGLCHTTCQVYDAPDPGDGWRLIDPKKDKPQEGDEIYERETRTWRRRLTKFQSWALSINRRRIEQPKPKYVPFEWEDRDKLRGRWVADVDGYEFLLVTLEWRSSGVIEMNGVDADSALEMWTFLDTGEPVGKRVD